MIAIGSAVFTIGNTLSDVISDAIGHDGLALVVFNATKEKNKTILKLVHQSSGGDKQSRGKWAGENHPTDLVGPNQEVSFASRKGDKATSGNRNGVVFCATQDDDILAYLRISWDVPILGSATYQISWSKTWDKSKESETLLTCIGDRKSALKKEKAPKTQAGDGLQKASFGGLHAISTFGTAPLKVVVYD